MITKNLLVYLGSDNKRLRVPVSQYDTMWTFVFTIINGSTEWTIPSGATVMLNGKKPDGNVFSFACTVANNKVSVDADVQMTAVAGDVWCELSVTANNTVVGTVNFVLAVEAAPVEDGAVASESDVDAYGAIVADEVGTYLSAHPEIIPGKGLTEDVKAALLACFAHVAWTVPNGQDYYDALQLVLDLKEMVALSAVFTQGSVTIYTNADLDSLKQYLVVKGVYDDASTITIGDDYYTLSGTLTAGTSTITVTYGELTTTFTATVTAFPYQYVTYIENEGDSNSWIELDVVPSDTFGFKSVISVAERTSDSFVWGTREITDGRILFGANASKKSYLGWGANSSNASMAPTVEWNTPQTLSLNYKNDRAATINDTNVWNVNGGVLAALGFTPTWNYMVLGYRNTSTTSGRQCRIYSMEITSGSDVIRDLHPCYRISDNAIGLYDTITDTFYGNSGTGDLAKGADVT